MEVISQHLYCHLSMEVWLFVEPFGHRSDLLAFCNLC